VTGFATGPLCGDVVIQGLAGYVAHDPWASFFRGPAARFHVSLLGISPGEATPPGRHGKGWGPGASGETCSACQAAPITTSELRRLPQCDDGRHAGIPSARRHFYGFVFAAAVLVTPSARRPLLYYVLSPTGSDGNRGPIALPSGRFGRAAV